jgi:hypothetical protein
MATLEEVKHAVIQAPSRAGGNWENIPHYSVIQFLKEAVKLHNEDPKKPKYKLLKPSYNLARSGSDMVFSSGLSGGNLHWTIAIENLHKRFHALAIYSGGGLEPDKQAILFREVIAAHKTDTNLILGALVAQAFSTTLYYLEDMLPGWIEELQKGRGDVQKYGQIAASKGLIPWSRLRILNAEFEESHRTRWDLLTCFNTATQLNPASKVWKQRFRFSEIVKGTT